MIIGIRYGFLFLMMNFAILVEAQNLESIINSKIFDLQPLSNGDWAAAIRKLPSNNFEYDSIGVRILDSTGITKKQFFIKPLVYNSEFQIEPLIVLPDQGFLFIYTSSKCDVIYNDYVIEKIDSVGNLIWHFTLYNFDYARFISLTPDDNLIIAKRDTVFKISAETGETLWKCVFPDFSFGWKRFLFVPGTEDLITGNAEGIKYYQHIESGGDHSYEEVHSYSMFGDLISFSILGSDQKGLFYGMSIKPDYSRDLYRFRADLQPTLIHENIGTFQDFKSVPGLFAITFGYDDHDLRVYDTLGQILSEWHPSAPGLTLQQMNITSNGLATGGDYVSGQTADLYPDSLAYFGREQGWFRYYPGHRFIDGGIKFSLAITDGIQIEAPAYDSTLIFGPYGNYYLFEISGGRFKLNIMNTGSETISEFDVNTMFNAFGDQGICVFTYPDYIHFEVPDILPGNSIWVEYAGFHGLDYSAPGHYCFWTSAPDSNPDDKPGDDMYCVENVVSTFEPETIPFTCYPNPATSMVSITYPLQIFHPATIKIIDVFGHIVRTSQAGMDTTSASIDVHDLPSGIYIIHADNFSKKVIIHH